MLNLAALSLGVAGVVAAGSLEPRHYTKYLTVPLRNCDGLHYCVNFQVGTPKDNTTARQLFNASLDTGSGETWVPAAECYQRGFKTWETKEGDGVYMNETFSVDYANGDHVQGSYYSEPITMGKKKVHSVAIGLTDDEPKVSRMGVGASSGGSGPANHGPGLPPILTALVNNSITLTPAFSLYLDPKSTPGTDGSFHSRVIFGGVDKSAYTGKLVQVPFYSSNDTYSVQLSSVSVSKPRHRTVTIFKDPTRAVLDSHLPVLVLPTTLAAPIAHQLNGTAIIGTTDTQELAYSCNASYIQKLDKQGVKINVQLTGGINIKVPPTSLAQIKGGECQLLILARTDQSKIVLGAPFLREAYTVFDPKYKRVAIAQSKPWSPDCPPDVTEICSQNLPLPCATVWKGHYHTAPPPPP